MEQSFGSSANPAIFLIKSFVLQKEKRFPVSNPLWIRGNLFFYVTGTVNGRDGEPFILVPKGAQACEQ
ncbi:hypothetical protein CF651_17320 [Paenibacillus rigui]|uniref:Uncharacterized protein n=1 Tax=Paenibacillus rigui TaxID=554312 RepID=A0A229UPP9_9BACL|nr:hypothetical protein CF651_17320 [Paenibacillus rigui]